MHIKKNEQISALSHLFGALLVLIGGGFLLSACEGQSGMILVALVYTACAFLMFFSSFIYHVQKKEENQNNFWRKFDHIAIFFMIAGSYTALCHIFLDGAWEIGIIIAQWALVVMGIFFKFFWLKAPRYLSTVIYVLMGWMIIIPIGQLMDSMSTLELWLLIGGGLSYTIGAVLYAIKKPNPVPNYFGFHEIFHLFVVVGAALHWIVIYLGLLS